MLSYKHIRQQNSFMIGCVPFLIKYHIYHVRITKNSFIVHSSKNDMNYVLICLIYPRKQTCIILFAYKLQIREGQQISPDFAIT